MFKIFKKLKSNNNNFSECIEPILNEIEQNKEYNNLEIIKVIKLQRQTNNDSVTNILEEDNQRLFSIFMTLFEDTNTSSLKIEDYHLLFAIYCWGLKDNNIQHIRNQLEETEIQTQINGGANKCLLFLETSHKNFEFQKEMNKIFFNILILFLKNGLKSEQLLFRIFLVMDRMKVTEVLNYFQMEKQETKTPLIGFFKMIFEAFKQLVENDNENLVLIDMLSCIIDMYFPSLKTENSEETEKILSELLQYLEEKNKAIYCRVKLIVYKVLLQFKVNDNKEKICKSFRALFETTYLKKIEDKWFRRCEFIEFVCLFFSNEDQLIEFMAGNPNKFPKFTEFIKNLINELKERISKIMEDDPPNGYIPQVSRTFAVRRFLTSLNKLKSLELNNELQKEIYVLCQKYEGVHKELFSSLLDINNIFSKKSDFTRIYCLAITDSIKLWPLKQEDEFLNDVINGVSNITKEAFVENKQDRLKFVVEIPNCLLSYFPYNFKKQRFDAFLKNSCTDIVNWIKFNNGNNLFMEIVDFASNCCMMDEGTKFQFALENAVNERSWSLIHDINCQYFLESLRKRLKQYQYPQINDFEDFLEETLNSLNWIDFWSNTNNEECESRQDESEDNDTSSFVESGDNSG